MAVATYQNRGRPSVCLNVTLRFEHEQHSDKNKFQKTYISIGIADPIQHNLANMFHFLETIEI